MSALELAWQYDPQDAGDFDTQIPTNPLIVNGVLYGLSARKNLFALNAATGEELPLSFTAPWLLTNLLGCYVFPTSGFSSVCLNAVFLVRKSL